MEKEFELLVDTLKKFEGFSFIDLNVESKWIHFKLNSDATLSVLLGQINELKPIYPFNLLVLANQDAPNDFSYQLIVEASDCLGAINSLTKRLLSIFETKSDQKLKQQELGIPDLSLVTIKQMGTELKKRHNLTFALIWIEDNEKDNIAIEGSGNPTQLVGLLTRGSHMAIEWADKNIRFYRSKDED